jgi:predicted pyridoxine 5'-phosphate oxidase superfamily flavin-nucleotide-binding protein
MRYCTDRSIQRGHPMSVFHAGERAMQQRTGEGAFAARNGAIIKGTIVAGARSFLAEQRMLVVGSADGAGQPWASVLFGPAGFASSERGERVTLRVDQVARSAADPLWQHLRAGAGLGLLAIDPATRRRLRVNGRIATAGDDAVVLQVGEAYPNCPKYIQRRRLVALDLHGPDEPSPERGATLDARRRDLIAAADTFFIASRHPERGLDVSHRGGAPGFVRVVDERTLRVPDYAGNGMFNTLGNLAIDDRAGLLFLDFTAARALQLAGRVALRFDEDEDGQPTGGTDRFWVFSVERWLETPLGVAFTWEHLDPSRYNP